MRVRTNKCSRERQRGDERGRRGCSGNETTEGDVVLAGLDCHGGRGASSSVQGTNNYNGCWDLTGNIYMST